MKIEDLKRIKDRRPFRPFTLVTADGTEIPIVHPDALAWGDPDSPRLVLAVSGNEQYWVDVQLVTLARAPAPIEAD